MDMKITISFAVICAVVALASQIYSIWNNHNKNVEETKREKIELEKNLIRLDLKLDNINKSIAALVTNHEKASAEIKAINESVIKYGESLKSAWNRIDNHEKRILEIEKEVMKP